MTTEPAGDVTVQPGVALCQNLPSFTHFGSTDMFSNVLCHLAGLKQPE